MTQREIEQDIRRAQAGDPAARERAVRASMSICYDVAHGFRDVQDWGADTLASYGTDGLMWALDQWSPDPDNRSWYWFAYWAVRRRVLWWRQWHNSEKRSLPSHRIETPVTDDHDDDGDNTLADILPDHRCPYTLYTRGETERRLLAAVIRALQPRDRIIVSLYYGFADDTWTMRAIGDLFGISHETVRQRLKRSRRRIREYLQKPGRNKQ